MREITFLSFADSHMERTLKRIGNEAKVSSFFDKIILVTEMDFDSQYWEENKDWFIHNKRGFGYWLWKPYFILRELNKMQEGNILVYCDAGCEINKNGKKRFYQYVNLLQNSDKGILGFNVAGRIKEYCKGDALDYFGLRNNVLEQEEQLIMAGILVLIKNKQTTNFVQKWKDTMHSQRRLIDDSTSKSSNDSSFKENRHDQSIFTLINCIENLVYTLPESEVQAFPIASKKWPPNNQDWRRLKTKPFLAIRNRSGEDRLGNYNTISLHCLNYYWDICNNLKDIYTNIRISIGKVRSKII